MQDDVFVVDNAAADDCRCVGRRVAEIVLQLQQTTATSAGAGYVFHAASLYGAWSRRKIHKRTQQRSALRTGRKTAEEC